MSDKTKANKSAKPAKGAKMDRFTESMLPETDGKIFKWAGTFMIVLHVRHSICQLLN